MKLNDLCKSRGIQIDRRAGNYYEWSAGIFPHVSKCFPSEVECQIDALNHHSTSGHHPFMGKALLLILSETMCLAQFDTVTVSPEMCFGWHPFNLSEFTVI